MSSRQQISEGAVDDKQLKAALDRLAEELAIPFVERHLTGKGGRKTAVEQLEDAVQELTTRERELSAAIGIANMLLTKNKELAEDCRSLYSEKGRLESTVAQIRQEKTVFGENLLEMEGRLKRVEKELETTERKLHEEQLTSHRLYEEVNTMACHPDAVSLLEATHQDTIDELHTAHAAELRALTKTLQSLEKENTALQRTTQETQSVLASKIVSLTSLQEEVCRLNCKLRKLREDKHTLTRRCTQAEDRAKYIELDLNIAQRRTEKLEEEVKLLSSTPTPSTSESGNKHERHTSLFAKLHGIEEDEEIETISDVEEGTNSGFGQVSWRKEMSLDLGNDSADEEIFSIRRELFPAPVTLGGRGKPGFKFGFEDTSNLRISVLEGVDIITPKRKLNIISCGSLHIQGKKGIQRKDPSEEYFLLATQAVKFSSPYMDSVCTVSAKRLYEQALQDGIAFHKWHTWIEDQLTRAYVKNLYSSDHRS